MSLLLLLACVKESPPQALPEFVTPAQLAGAWSRTTPARLRAKLQVKIQQGEGEQLRAASVGGALLLDRPGRARLDLMHPLAGRLYTAVLAQDAAALWMMDDKRYLFTDDLAGLLAEFTGGLRQTDDVIGLFTGELPLDGAVPVGARDGGVVLGGPSDTRWTVWLGENGTLSAFKGENKGGIALLSATYGPYAEVAGASLPTRLTVAIPSILLSLDLRFDGWTALDVAPDAFGLGAPEGYRAEPMEDALQAARERQPKSP